MAKKRGQFSNEELEYLKHHKETMTVEAMADHLGRTPESIKQNIFRVDSSYKRLEETKQFEKELKTRPYWKNLKIQYTPEELELYEYHWIKYVQQFREDITHAEESQILKAIDLEMMLERNKINRSKTEKAIDALQDVLDEELGKDEDFRDKNFIMNLQQQLTSLRAALQSTEKAFSDMLKEYQNLMKALKSTRDQRLKDVESRDVTFFGWLKKFEDKATREKISRQAEMMRVAIQREKEKLGQYHTYDDGELDRPLLNAETVKGDEDNG